MTYNGGAISDVRDERAWLRKCLHVSCPIERCLVMRLDDGEDLHGVYVGRPFGPE